MAALGGERARDEVESLLRTPPAMITAVNIGEVVDVLTRVHRIDSEDVAEKLDWLIAGGLEVVAVTARAGRLAGELRATHYHRSTAPVSFADCVALAIAADRGEALATADPALAAIARLEGVEVIGLPDSQGRRP